MRQHAQGRHRPRAGQPGGGAGRKLRAPTNERRTRAAGGVKAVALLRSEPAGTLAPRVAGLARFRATLAWRGPADVPREPALVAPPGPARFALSECEDPDAATRHLRGEVRALSQRELGAGLEALLRALTTFATLTEATLEVGVVRNLPPRVASRRVLEALARDVREAGFPVRIAPSWTPAPEADAYLGVGGDDGLAEFVFSLASWRAAP